MIQTPVRSPPPSGSPSRLSSALVPCHSLTDSKLGPHHPLACRGPGHFPSGDCRAVFAFREEACVLVHGAEGTDTTLLVTALAQVILDPDCRTLAGFQGLLQREWIEVTPSRTHPRAEEHFLEGGYQPKAAWP